MNDYTFGNFVCMLREKKGLTQAEVARQLGVTPAAVSKWENGSSKPRVEVLFQLAGILGVRPEELMAGRYLVEETLDTDVVRQINERYAYLQRIDSYATTKVKLLRLLAFILDWNIVGLFVLLLLSVYLEVLSSAGKALAQGMMLGAMFIILLYPVLVVLRDVLMKGRSLGKRITGLVILDKHTGEPAKGAKPLIRDLFLFVLQVDAIVLLISGMSIGDKVAHTVVVRKKDLHSAEDMRTEPSPQAINRYVAPRPVTKKKVLIVVGAIAAAFVLFGTFVFVVVSTALNAKKETGEYTLAYVYLVESSAFAALDVPEDKIKFTSYSTTVRRDPEGNAVRTAEFGFFVSGKMYYVICHEENELWQVCSDCTKFD